MPRVPEELETDPRSDSGIAGRAGWPPSAAPPRHAGFFRWLTYLVLFPLFFVATAIFGSISLIASLFDGTGRVEHSIAQAWAGVVLRIALSPVRVIGAE